MAINTNNQASPSHEIPSQNLRSINIQDLWSHDKRRVNRSGRRGLVYGSSPLRPGRSSPEIPTSSIGYWIEGTNEVEVVIEGTTQNGTGTPGTGDFSHNSFIAVYRGLDWRDSLAMLNWRLQGVYAERDESSTIATNTTFSSIQSDAMASGIPEDIVEETIAEEAVGKKAISSLELEPCYSILPSVSLNDKDRDSEGINSQKPNVSIPTIENPTSEPASSAPHPENIYHGLSWAERLKVLNQNLREAYKNDAGNINTSANKARPQINFYAEDPPILPRSYPPGLFIPPVPPPPTPMTQGSSLGCQQQVCPTYEPNWGPYPYFSEQKPQIPHHLFCPSASHAATCGGIFVDPRAVAAIDHVVYNSAMVMFENFRRQYLAMEGKSNVGWWPVHGSGLDARGATHSPAWAVNGPGVSGDSSAEGEATRGMGEEPRDESYGEANKEAKVGAQNTTATGTNAQTIIPRLSVRDSSIQVCPEPAQDQLIVTETSTASSQTEAIEIASTRSFGVQTEDPEVTATSETISSSAQITSTKISSIDISTDVEDLPAQTHSAPETQPQPPATRKHKHRKKNKAKMNISNTEPHPHPQPPPPQPHFSTLPCESPGTLEQTTASIAIEKVKTPLEPLIHQIPIPVIIEQDGELVTASLKQKAPEAITHPDWFKAIMFCSLLFLALDLAFQPEGDT
ncbi:unnamed protein product [Tuber aestivum]|uniref:Uncharacterized protein n=1 Tax=Tuber aestivum TaxID=59557 RepID=A0A292PK68_9PEZI|nr:unnamed protein product [Tuber aestivum]